MSNVSHQPTPVRAALPKYLLELVEDLEPTDEHLIRETWWAGFTVGRDGIPALPSSDLAPDLAEQWSLGYASGFDSWESEMLAWAEEEQEQELAQEAVGKLARALHYCELVEALGCDAARQIGGDL